MRALNYSNVSEAYAAWNHTAMVRVALVEGLAANITDRLGPSEAEKRQREAYRYLGLLKQYTDESLQDRIERAFDIINQRSLSERQQGYVHALMLELEKPQSWKRLDNQHLQREGVVIRYSGDDLSELVNLIYTTTEDKVIVIEGFPLDADADYIKHVSQHTKLLLNGKQVIEHFASMQGVTLSNTYSKYGRLTNEVKEKLERANFTFNIAFEHAVHVMQEHPEIFIAMFVIKNSDGNEIRIFPYELVAGTELYYEFSSSDNPERKVFMRHGDIEGEFKYNGCNIFAIPKRTPFDSRGQQGRSATHDEVEVHYLPHVERPREMVLEWMETRTSCNCDSALNLRNFEERRGRTVRVVNSFDAHARAVLLYISGEENITAKNDEYGLILYPTEGFIRLVDRFRYNLSNGKGSVGIRDISFLVNEALKLGTNFNRKFTTTAPKQDDVLKPKYLVRQRKRLEK